MSGMYWPIAFAWSAKRKAALGIEETHVLRVSAGRTFPLEELRITTFRSTDAGVAFLVETGREKPYSTRGFARWHWEEEPKHWNDEMEREFKRKAQS